MKGELLKEAMELAQKCRECHEEFEKEKAKEDASVKRMENMLVDATRYHWALIGFCRALFKVGVFDDKDIEAIWNVVFPTEFSAGIKGFIEGLEGLDSI